MRETLSPKYKILYADDDEDDRQLLQEVFADYSPYVEIICFVNGAAIIAYLHDLPPHAQTPCLVILDINMPLVNGKDVLKNIRSIERFANTPVVLFTTSGQLKDKQFAEQHRAGFITKPIDAEQLRTIAEIFVDHCADEVKKNILAINS